MKYITTNQDVNRKLWHDSQRNLVLLAIFIAIIGVVVGGLSDASVLVHN